MISCEGRALARPSQSLAGGKLEQALAEFASHRQLSTVSSVFADFVEV